MTAHRVFASAVVLAMTLVSAAVADSDSVNWSGTVGDPITELQSNQFRYDLDPRLPAAHRQGGKAASSLDCMGCGPSTAFQLSADERLEQRLRHSYRKFGEDLAARMWSSPNGRRVRFDVAGRPGLGLEIPLD